MDRGVGRRTDQIREVDKVGNDFAATVVGRLFHTAAAAGAAARFPLQ